jgi:hypothetical protein
MNGQFHMDFIMDYNIQKTTCKIMNMNFYLPICVYIFEFISSQFKDFQTH